VLHKLWIKWMPRIQPHQQMRKENLTKNVRMHRLRNAPAITVVIAPAVTEMPMVVSAIRVRVSRSVA
jgi:hypothetical protein